MDNPKVLPQRGMPKEAVLARMQAARDRDVHWREGRVFSLVFPAGLDVEEVASAAYTLFFGENGLNPTAFPSLRTFETEVVAMTAALLGGDAAVAGNMTSGGTESILLAVKTARDWARVERPHIQQPEIVACQSVHPAFHKAAHYFGLRVVTTPPRADLRADVERIAAAISANTILLVGSAPAYPHGVVDPIAGLAQLAADRGLLMHVDACVGGMLLPFARRLGFPVPDFDFTVPGVTSISVDLHKYGYAAKGASVILYRSASLRRHQFFVATGWPGGIYPSPSMTGTRPGGAIAAAWAVMNYLGEAGYLALADQVMGTAQTLQAGIARIDGVHVLGKPDMSVMAIASDRHDIYDIGDELTLRGWHLDRQQFPPSLHLTVMPAHAATANAFLDDLAAAVAAVRRPSLARWRKNLLLSLVRLFTRLLPPAMVSRLTGRFAPGGGAMPMRTAAIYGLIGSLPNRGDVDNLVLDLLDSMTRPPSP